MWALNQNYSNEMSRPNGHKQNYKKYRGRMRAPIMRAKLGTRVRQITELEQDQVRLLRCGLCFNELTEELRFYTSIGLF